MSLKVNSRIPYGNAADVEIDETGEIPEVRFASDPDGGPEALWFHFRLTETQPEPPRTTKVRLVWRHFDNSPGGGNPSACAPVCQPTGQSWMRLKQGEEAQLPDGRRQVVWYIGHPAPHTDVALCFPYGPGDVDATIERSKEYWQRDVIGLSQAAHRIVRLNNGVGAPGGTQPGIYLIARQNPGETPGSWVLDGLLRQLAQVRKAGYIVWSVPLAGIDGVLGGNGRGACDLTRAWGRPPPRHETRVLCQDLQRWKERCRPILALDLRAAGAGERDGVYSDATNAAADPLAAEETRWANTIQNELKAEFAAADFKRGGAAATDSHAATFHDFAHGVLQVPALTLNIPYAMVGSRALTQKDYREIGRRLMEAIVRRRS